MTRRTRELLCLFLFLYNTIKAAEEQVVEFSDSNDSDVDPFAGLYKGNIPPFIKVRLGAISETQTLGEDASQTRF